MEKLQHVSTQTHTPDEHKLCQLSSAFLHMSNSNLSLSILSISMFVPVDKSELRRITVSKIGVIICTIIRLIQDLLASLILSEILPCGLGQQMLC